MSKGRVIVVSNRLPITIKKNDSEQGDKWTYKMSSGGLVSALSGLKKVLSFRWIGWPGFEVEGETDKSVMVSELESKYSCVPVFLSAQCADLHYNGFSNGTMWPLFHYLPGDLNFHEEQWRGYQEANMAFALTIKDHVKEGDIIWVHDYHLMLLPEMLRGMLGHLSTFHIGFFLHTPFPSSEVYRVLPVRAEILTGVLNCDLVGFHTYDYARHFISSCARILGHASHPNGVEFGSRFVHIGTFPIGIEPNQWIQAIDSDSVQERVQQLSETFKNCKVIIGVDRLDYIKGVPHKLYAFEQYLEQYPEDRGKLVLIQVAVPTRQDVEEYKNLRSLVNELVGRINGRFGEADYTPIQYLYKSVSFTELSALYRVADVSYEYVANQYGKDGVLVLSEFAGAAQSMNGAIIINPWNIDEVVAALHEALHMSKQERSANHEKLWKYVEKHTAQYWGCTFIDEMVRLVKEEREYIDKRKTLITAEFINQQLQKSGSGEGSINNALFFYDLDGCGAVETLKAFIERHSQCTIYIWSRKDIIELAKLFPAHSIGLIAENGSVVRHPQCNGEWHKQGKPSDTIPPTINALLQTYTRNTSSASLNAKEQSMEWDYSLCDREFGGWQAAELAEKINYDLKGDDWMASIRKGPSLVDVRCKDSVIENVLTQIVKSHCGENEGVCNVICMGEIDPATFQTICMDEDKSKELNVICVRKGRVRDSKCPFYIDDVEECLDLLKLDTLWCKH